MDTDSSKESRQSHAEAIRNVVLNPSDGANIVWISGPGGVGKTFLLNWALEALDLRKEKYLRLHINARNRQICTDFLALLDTGLAPANLPYPETQGTDYFPQSRRIIHIYQDICRDVRKELDRKGVSEELKLAVLFLVRSGRFLNIIYPPSRPFLELLKYVSDEEVHKALNEAYEKLNEIQSLWTKRPLGGAILDLSRQTFPNQVKQSLYRVCADALLGDLSAFLALYRKRDRWRLTRGKNEIFDKLLLVVDDFEALSPVLEKFLVDYLIPGLADMDFKTVLFIISRDVMRFSDPGWDQHCRKYVRSEIHLQPFTEAEAFELMARRNIPEQRAQEIYRETQGLPFLLTYLIDEAVNEEADSAPSLRAFLDRTTRWMNEKQRNWFITLCYLKKINIDILTELFPEENAEIIQEWFEKEASIRSPGPIWQVRPLISNKVRKYQQLRSPKQHREISERVAVIEKDAE